jgi:hypothetical protein
LACPDHPRPRAVCLYAEDPGDVTGGDAQRDIAEKEKAICRALGKRVAEVTKKLRGQGD